MSEGTREAPDPRREQDRWDRSDVRRSRADDSMPTYIDGALYTYRATRRPRFAVASADDIARLAILSAPVYRMSATAWWCPTCHNAVALSTLNCPHCGFEAKAVEA